MAVPFQVADGGTLTTSRAGLGQPLMLCQALEADSGTAFQDLVAVGSSLSNKCKH